MKKKIKKIVFLILLCLFTFNNKVYAETDTMDCEDLGDLQTDLNNVLNFIKIVIPLLVIGLSTYDFIKAIANKDDKDIKKAFTKLSKRLIYAVIFFFLPILIELFLGMLIDNADVCIGK